MEQSPFPIELLTPDGKIAKVNNAYRQLWNLTEEEVVQLKKNYNILEDKQIEELGIMPLVKRAFKGELDYNLF